MRSHAPVERARARAGGMRGVNGAARAAGGSWSPGTCARGPSIACKHDRSAWAPTAGRAARSIAAGPSSLRVSAGRAVVAATTQTTMRHHSVRMSWLVSTGSGPERPRRSGRVHDDPASSVSPERSDRARRVDVAPIPAARRACQPSWSPSSGHELPASDRCGRPPRHLAISAGSPDRRVLHGAEAGRRGRAIPSACANAWSTDAVAVTLGTHRDPVPRSLTMSASAGGALQPVQNVPWRAASKFSARVSSDPESC